VFYYLHVGSNATGQSTEREQPRTANNNQNRSNVSVDRWFVKNSFSLFNQWLSAAPLLCFGPPIWVRILPFGWAEVAIDAAASHYANSHIRLRCNMTITRFNNPKATSVTRCFVAWKLLTHSSIDMCWQIIGD
jgi:hypothetical protein